MAENSLQQTVGYNFRAIREAHKLTREQICSHARRLGLPWTPSKVGDFENGRHRVYADVLAAAVTALDSAVGQGHGATQRRPRVTLADLLRSDAPVAINPDLVVTSAALTRVFQGKPPELWGGIDTDDVTELLDDAPGLLGERYRMRVADADDIRKRSGLTEKRLAARLGISDDHLAGLSWTLWDGRTYSEQRNRLAGPNRAGRRTTGQTLTQQLQAELWKEARGND